MEAGEAVIYRRLKLTNLIGREFAVAVCLQHEVEKATARSTRRRAEAKERKPLASSLCNRPANSVLIDRGQLISTEPQEPLDLRAVAIKLVNVSRVAHSVAQLWDCAS